MNQVAGDRRGARTLIVLTTNSIAGNTTALPIGSVSEKDFWLWFSPLQCNNYNNICPRSTFLTSILVFMTYLTYLVIFVTSPHVAVKCEVGYEDWPVISGSNHFEFLYCGYNRGQSRSDAVNLMNKHGYNTQNKSLAPLIL